MRHSNKSFLAALTLSAAFSSGCSVAASKEAVASRPQTVSQSSAKETKRAESARITIDAGGPADTVRVFYRHLRNRKFREAIFLTNLRPAIEGLTDSELAEFALDFEAIAGQVPPEVEITGEIITGEKATVTANLPTGEDGRSELQAVNLAREDGVWTIRSAADEAAEVIRREGKNYFYNLRISTHEEEARLMLERISKAQFAYSLQNNGLFADIRALVASSLMPDDVTTSESTGYVYAIQLTADMKRFAATATPAEYGRSGKVSYLLSLDDKGVSRVTGTDIGGKVMTK